MPPDLSAEALGNRHLLGFNSTQKQDFYTGRVRVRASPVIAASRTGQVILWWLTNLLARQFGVVRHLEFDVPNVPMHAGVALFGIQSTLHQTLLDTGAKIAKDRITVTTTALDMVDVVLHVGPRVARGTNRDLALWGDGWRCAAADALDLPNADSRIVVGPMLAATLGAAEVFQRITNWHGEGRKPRPPLYFSAWDGNAASEWGALAIGPDMQPLAIEPFYLCGAGAVGQALVATLAYFPERSGHAVVIDGDPLDRTNLNRYCLAHHQSPAGKTDACKAVLETATFAVDTQPFFWAGYQQRPLPRTTSPTLNADEAAFKYRLLISCVDKNGPRHDLQNFWPRLMLGGSTSSLTAKLSRYDCFTGECLKCANPLPALPTIEDEANALRAMTPSERERALSELNPEQAKIVRNYLEQPGCGHAAEQYLTELGEIRRREFSVGFVSVASGIFLAVALIQHAWNRNELIHGGTNHFAFSFLSRRPGRDFFGRDPHCDCSGSGGALFRQLWASGAAA